MSKSRGCVIVRWTDKKWYSITAHDEYDYDFKDFTITGPFKDEATASENHDGCNPGGSYTVKCKSQNDLGLPHLVQAMRKYIKNGYKNPSFVGKTIKIHRRAW